MKNDIIENIRLEVKAPIVKSSISVRVGDTSTRTLHITLASSGNVVSLENALIAEILIEKPDGNKCYNNCVISGDEIQYTITSQAINVEGKCVCQVMVTFDDGAVVTSPEFAMVVYEPRVNQKIVKSMNEYTAVTEQLVMAKQYTESASASASVAENSETLAAESCEQAIASATAAAVSEENAAASEMNAVASAESALGSANAAENSEISAAESCEQAMTYATAAAVSEENAAQYKEDAGQLARAANASAINAKDSEINAATSANVATDAENSAVTAQKSAQQYEEAAREIYEQFVTAGQLTLGAGHNQAYYGDYGQSAYEHSQTLGNPHGATASDVGADEQGAAQASYENAIAYVDIAIANLINGAPTTLDTLKEIADAMTDNGSVVEALEQAIGNKAGQEELDTHLSNETIHIKASERAKWNAYEARIADIENLIQALGYPMTTST